MKSFKQLEEYIYFHKENQILNFIAIIIDIKIGLLEGFIQLTLSNGNEKCEQFIIKNGDIKIYIQNEIQINKINIKEINNCLYFEIINFQINKKKYNLKLNVPIYQFKKIQKINSLNDEILTNNPLISIDLKYKNRKFFDIKNKNIEINLNNLNYNFENEKIYSFSNFMIKNNMLESINISSIEELNPNSNTFQFKGFSNITIEEKTVIEFKFIDYIKNNNKYNIIQIDNQLIEIKDSIIQFELKNTLSLNYYTKKIKFLNKKNNENISSYDLFVEIYKGKKNKILAYLNLDNTENINKNKYQTFKLPSSKKINQ